MHLPIVPEHTRHLNRKQPGAAADIQQRHAAAHTIHAEHLARVKILPPQRQVKHARKLARQRIWTQILRSAQRCLQTRRGANARRQRIRDKVQQEAHRYLLSLARLRLLLTTLLC